MTGIGERLRPQTRTNASTPCEASALQSDVLEDLSAASNYIRWFADLAAPWLGEDPIEIGSGHGDYAAAWSSCGIQVTVSEADPGRLALLRQRFAGNPHVRVRQLEAPVAETGDHSAAVVLNVLEHIEDDVEALRSFAGLVRPGGHVVLIVPAFLFAMSQFDRAIGHHRRYRRRGLTQALLAAGLDPVVVRYVNPVGLLAWVVVMRLLRSRPRDGSMLRLYDGFVVPVLRRLDRHVPAPFGQSVFAVAQVPMTSAPIARRLWDAT